MTTCLPTPTSQTQAAADQPLRGQRFLWLLVPPWDNVWTRQNHFTTRLAQLGAEVLYVENSFSTSTLLKQGQLGGRVFCPSDTFKEKAPGLTVMTPPPVLPGGMHFDFIGRLNARRITASIQAWMTEHGWTDYTCWCRVPLAQLLVENLQPSRVYYDITDDYKHFYTRQRVIDNLDRREKRLVDRCRKIFYTAESLGSLENLRGKPACLLSNGVDYDLFSQAASPELPTHPLLAPMKKPVIGYVGLTSDWTDFDLLRKLGERFPGQIVMVGPIHPKVEAAARAISGLIWTGFVKDRCKLPSLLKGFSVCIMPFLTNHLTQNMNPLKVWEYLATGKSFVSVDLPGLGEARPLIDVASTRDEFVGLVEQRLRGEPSERSVARQRLARKYSWDALFQQLLQHLSLSNTNTN